MNTLPELERGIIRTYTGKMFNVFEPDQNIICIEDIAHALSNLCRFGGHTRHFYSVAEHSIRVAEQINGNNRMQLAALLHDGAEAYLMDLPTPVKRFINGYGMMEQRIMERIARKFGFQYPFHKDVIAADEALLQIEWNEQMNGTPSTTQFVNPAAVEDMFLNFYNHLK